MSTQKSLKKPFLLLAFASTMAIQAYAQKDTEPLNTLKEVRVINLTPLPGLGQTIEEVPTNVQSATAKDIEQSQAINLADFLNKNFGSVHVNDNSGNPFQVDINYRGYTASPLLGTPQGLSVYMDGVRMNQPFGDAVSWDLVPKSAIQGISLMPGSNPLFGLNTLGGALSIQTKDGLTNPGTEAEISLGMHNRISTEIQKGGVTEGGISYYLLGSKFTEDGWRPASKSDINQVFSKFGWKNKDTDLKLTYAYSGGKLMGGGFQQENLLQSDRRSVFTKDDITNNSSHFLNLEGKHVLNDAMFLTGNAYYRNSLSLTSNADINEESFGQGIYSSGESGVGRYSAAQVLTLKGLSAERGGSYTRTTANTNARYSSTGFFPSAACITNANSNDEPNEKCTGILNTTRSSQNTLGLSGQLNFLSDVAWGSNTLVVGSSYDKSQTQFGQNAQFGYLNADRSLTTVKAFADGTQTSEGAFSQQVNLDSGTTNFSVFGSNTLSTASQFHISVAARYNSSKVTNTDNLTNTNNAKIESTLRAHCSAILAANRPAWCVTGLATGRWPGTNNTLTARHTFNRINPAIGLSFTPNPGINPYVNYSESSRAPTSIELGCADPDFGCRLPNSMAGDPPLKQVIAKSFELGARGKTDSQLNWNAGLFQSRNSDDILFVANSSSTGYFRNFGKTKRVGAELGVSNSLGKFSYTANYTYLKATYETDEIVGSPYNSKADDGKIQIKAGNQIPLIPKQLLKLQASYQFTPKYNSGLQLISVGSSYARGNENNMHQSGVENESGVTSYGSGKVPAYTVFNWVGTYQEIAQLTYFSNITNLFDRKYYTSGQLGPAAFTANGGYNNGGCDGVNWNPTTHEGACVGGMMYSSGAPRTIYVGVRYMFDKPKAK